MSTQIKPILQRNDRIKLSNISLRLLQVTSNYTEYICTHTIYYKYSMYIYIYMYI